MIAITALAQLRPQWLIGRLLSKRKCSLWGALPAVDVMELHRAGIHPDVFEDVSGDGQHLALADHAHL
jgi:hypothetical protein